MQYMTRKIAIRLSIFVVLVVLAALLLSLLTKTPDKNDGSQSTNSITTSSNFRLDGIERTYTVHVPYGYSPNKAYPVLFGLHGGFGTSKQFEQSSGLSELADQRGFIAVYGQGTSWGRIKAPVWNAGGCCGKAVDAQKNIDDVGYAREVMKRVGKDYRVDTARLFVTGMSNGGMMANRLACEAADLFAGAAIVSGTIQVSSCTPSKQLPILIIHGTADANVPYYGGTGSKAINQSTYIPVEQEFAEWGVRNGCSGAVTTVRQPDDSSTGKTVDKLSYPRCRQPTILYRINDGEHEWPGGQLTTNRLERSEPTKVMNASRTIVDFFGF